MTTLTTSATSLTDFLMARWAEQEAAVNRGRPHPDRATFVNDNYGYLWVQPEYVLADIEAKRRLLALHESVPYWGLDRYGRWLPQEGEPKRWYCECQSDDGMIQGDDPCATKIILASVFVDHPDFNPDWR